MVDIMSAHATGNMTMEEFMTQVGNHREVLNSLLRADEDLHNEKMLLGALSGLEDVNDFDAVSVATRETRSQLSNILVQENNTEALKTMYEVLHICLTNREEGLQALSVVQTFSNIVVHLGANGGSGDATPLREALIAAERIRLGEDVADYELKILLEQMVVPAVEGNCSNPKSKDLQELMATIGDLVNQQKLASSTKDMVTAQSRCQDGHNSVLDAVNDHRKRLAYRQRRQVAKESFPYKIQLRAIHERTGAEWSRAKLTKVDLKHRDLVEKSQSLQAFESFDIDKNGTITIDEIITYLLSVPKEKRPKGLEDVNPFQKSKMKKRLMKMDNDNDGELSFTEFEAWWNTTHEE
jgi:hypothetical protein